nr:hypothetical protein Hi04_10k_c4335_00006 [uncultured bacterium]
MPELVDRRIRVSVVPPTPAFNNNALFECRRQDTGSHSPNTHWADCFAEVHKIGAKSNVLFGTADVMSMEDCDVVVYIAQPDSPKDVLRHKQKHPTQKAILVMSETSLGARYVSNPRNHIGYDAIFTYVEPLVDNKRYFFFPPRAFYRHRIVEGLPFEQRRFGCLVGTNRRMRNRIGVFTMRKGWKFSLRDWLDYVFCPGELISYRSELGKACAAYQGRSFDVFGEGWDLIPEMEGVCRGIPKGSTLSYVGRYRYYFALENHTSACALISERVWDALWGDTVPVYLGHTGIDRFIPRECYIDARCFKNPVQLLQTLHDTPESTWKKYRLAGREFIRSTAVEKYLPKSFAEEFVRRVAEVASGKHSGVRV